MLLKYTAPRVDVCLGPFAVVLTPTIGRSSEPAELGAAAPENEGASQLGNPPQAAALKSWGSLATFADLYASYSLLPFLGVLIS